MPVTRGPLGLPDRYRLDGLIATGGMAAVYAAHDTVLDRPVAVKVLAEHLTQNLDAARRFEREARAAAALSNHPAVVTIYDVGEHDGRSFIVMERRMAGSIADELQQRGRPDRERSLGWLAEIAAALDAAHARGIVHRDIKPGNLLLDDHDRVAVADFGIASLAHDAERVTQTGEVLGTGAYLAPEQAAEQAEPASDRYALAIVAYELLTGEQPYLGGSFASQIRAHAEDAPPAAPGLPVAAQDVLKRGMAKRPEDRWPSAGAMVSALKASFASVPDPDPAVTEATVAFTGPPRRSNRRMIAVLCAVLGAALVGVAIASTGSDDPKPTTAADKPAKKHKDKPRKTPTPEPTATAAVATATATATSTPEATATAVETQVAGGGDPSALNAEGFDLLKQGNPQAAVTPLQNAVASCEGSSELDPCGYAYYNLGLALNRSGRSDEAIPVLEARMKIWGDNPSGDVQQELDAARGGGGTAPAPAEKPGKGHGKAKGHSK
jgi:serine/threonine-protein kinase